MSRSRSRRRFQQIEPENLSPGLHIVGWKDEAGNEHSSVDSIGVLPGGGETIDTSIDRRAHYWPLLDPRPEELEWARRMRTQAQFKRGIDRMVATIQTARLTTMQRAALLGFARGFSADVVAKAMGKSVETVRKIARRGAQRLDKQLRQSRIR